MRLVGRGYRWLVSIKSSYAIAVGITMASAIIGALEMPAAQVSSSGPGPVALHVVSASPKVVLTIGDSIMKGYGLSPGQAWPFLVASADHWQLTNVACNGAGVLKVGSPNDCDENFARIIDSHSTLSPDIVIFEGSSNDFGLPDADLTAATITELADIRTTFPKAQIFGFSTLWGSTAPPAQLTDVNSQVRAAVQQVGGTYVDLEQPMSGHPELMQSDDIHPNAQGQAVIARTVEADLSAIARADKLREARISSGLRSRRMQ